MASTESLGLLLHQIFGKLSQHPAFVGTTGKPIDDPSYYRDAEELETLAHRLGLIVRELKQKTDLLKVQGAGVRKLPPAMQWSAASSVRTQQAAVDRVRQRALELQKLLENIIRKNGMVNEGDAAQNIAEFIEKLAHSFHTHGEVQMNPPLTYVPYTQNHAGSLEGITIAVFVALRALTALMKRKRGV